MTLQIKNLTKFYGKQKAVDNISFDVQKGEILGFLGPNGAGKSTTMKVSTTYIPPDEGVVTVCGEDVTVDPMAVKRVVGYLPEHNPLYLDMYIHEYLRFVGRLFGLRGQRLQRRVEEMIDVCGLAPEQHKRMEALSKGYRQRVGLAQALLHDPEVLILDEPTSGLDPNQILEIRRLIKTFSVNKTVIFSTHILQEVQALCDRVVVINKGVLVADEKLENLLARQTGRQVLVVDFEHPVAVEEFSGIAGVGHVEMIGATQFRITATSGDDIRHEVFRFAAEKKLSLTGLRAEENSLESIFRELTRQPDNTR